MAIFGLSTEEKKYLPMAAKAANQYGVDVALIFAHIKQESNFNPMAMRKEPAIKDASFGLMQILLKTAKEIDSSATASKLLNDPEFNISIGTRYIAKNLKRWGNVPDAIAAYNAGSPMKNILGQYVNTQGITNVQNYVDKVTKNLNYYQKQLRGFAIPLITMPEISITSYFPIIAVAIILGTIYFSTPQKRVSYAR